jgi:hypothetical protein
MKSLMVVAMICGSALAQDFESAVVLEARMYERQSSTFGIAGATVAGNLVDMSRVTVALDGMRVTGEFESESGRSARATDLKVGSEVPAAIERNRLVLQMPDGTVVRAKIVRREKIRVPGQTRD